MGTKKEALILKALEERQRHAGRHLLADDPRGGGRARRAPARAAHRPRDRAGRQPAARLRYLRRLDILASGADCVADGRLRRLSPGRARARPGRRRNRACSSAAVFRRICGWSPRESRGAALQYFTGSKAHNIALRDRAIGLGFKLNEYGLFRTDDGTRGRRRDAKRTSTKRSGSPGSRPSFAKARGEIEAAAARQLPRLIDRADLRGDLHMHTTETDGNDTIAAMAIGRARRRPRIHRHHRSQPVAGDGQWARRARVPSSTRRASARSTDRSAACGCSPGSNATSSPTARSTSPTTASPPWTSSSRRSTRRSIRTAGR